MGLVTAGDDGDACNIMMGTDVGARGAALTSETGKAHNGAFEVLKQGWGLGVVLRDKSQDHIEKHIISLDYYESLYISYPTPEPSLYD